jgi:hemerythrin
LAAAPRGGWLLKQWLNHHTLHRDVAYSDFLRARLNASRTKASSDLSL